MAAFVIDEGLCSGRAACRCLRLARARYRYRARPLAPEHARLVTRLRELSRQHPRYGFLRIAGASVA